LIGWVVCILAFSIGKSACIAFVSPAMLAASALRLLKFDATILLLLFSTVALFGIYAVLLVRTPPRFRAPALAGVLAFHSACAILAMRVL
jgi:hypothetical protein